MPAKYDITGLYRNDYYPGFQVTITQTVSDVTTPIDLTGYTLRLQIKKCADDETAIVDLTNGSGITLTDAANGIATIDGFNVPDVFGTYVYDLQYTTAGGQTTTYLVGTVTIEKDVTR